MDIEIAAERPAARHHRPQRGRQDGGAEDPGPARAHGAGGLPRARAGRARGCPCSRSASPSWATTRAWRRTSRRSPPSSSSSARCSSAWTPARSCCSTSWARAPIPTTAPRWPRRCWRTWPTRGALVVASTHLEPLKGFASTHPRARNASVEFDPERLAPTFRLVYDRPGQSYALSIGARLGLPAALIERAHAHRSTQQRQLQELLARLDDRDRQDAERGALLERREAESAGLLARAQAELEAARASARETIARAKAEAQRLVTEVRRARERGVGPAQAGREEPAGAGARAQATGGNRAEGGAHCGGPRAGPGRGGPGRRRAIASRSRISGSRGTCWAWTARR